MTDLTGTDFGPVNTETESRLMARLHQELHAQHALWPMRDGLELLGAGNATPDDLLLATGDAAQPFATVHLSWALPGLFRAKNPKEPYSKLYPDWNAVLAEIAEAD